MAEFQRSNRRLLIAFAAAVLVLSAILLIVSYTQQVRLYEKQELARLEGIASTLTLGIDANELEYLLERYPDKDAIRRNSQDSAYLNIHRTLVAAQEVNKLTTPIYLLRYTPAREKFCFAVTSAEKPYWLHGYHDYPEQLVSLYDEGGHIEMYEDSNGTWLSAFRPIRNTAGQTMAVVQVDEQFDRFLYQAQSSALGNSAVSVLIAGGMLLITFFIIQQLTRQQQRLHDEKSRLVELRTELLSNLSHDLRTPLSNVQGYIETALLKVSSEELPDVKRYLNIGLRNTEKLSRMIDELFELSKIESRRRLPKPVSFSIAELIFDTLSSFSMKAKRAGVQLQSQIPEDLPPVSADIAMIDRVLQNTIGNAVLYTPEGGSVTVRATAKRQKVLIEIIDTGSGIPPEELTKVFERFHRSANAVEGGSGLGLAVVKGILDLHEANFGMESEVGEGTRFWFELSRS